MEKLIRQVTLKNGKEAFIFHADQVLQSRGASLFLRTQAENIDAGFCVSIYSFGPHTKAVLCEVDGKIVGGIAYEFAKEKLLAWIALSFTDPDWRGNGINEACHYVMEDIVKEQGAKQIGSVVHVNNTKRLRSAEKVGLKPEFYRMIKRL